jgi:hypothetical protein
VPIGGRLAAALAVQVERGSRAGYTSKEPLVRTKTGRPYTRQLAWEMVAVAGLRAGIEDMHPHRLRVGQCVSLQSGQQLVLELCQANVTRARVVVGVPACELAVVADATVRRGGDQLHRDVVSRPTPPDELNELVELHRGPTAVRVTAVFGLNADADDERMVMWAWMNVGKRKGGDNEGLGVRAAADSLQMPLASFHRKLRSAISTRRRQPPSSTKLATSSRPSSTSTTRQTLKSRPSPRHLR